MDKKQLLQIVADEINSGVNASYHVRVIWKKVEDARDFDQPMLGIARQWQTERWFFEPRAGAAFTA
jgi:hypothetical protein